MKLKSGIVTRETAARRDKRKGWKVRVTGNKIQPRFQRFAIQNSRFVNFAIGPAYIYDKKRSK